MLPHQHQAQFAVVHHPFRNDSTKERIDLKLQSSLRGCRYFNSRPKQTFLLHKKQIRCLPKKARPLSSPEPRKAIGSAARAAARH